ncbi:hypothetical protein [Natrialba aegyptia]|uniref:hypothetical protein n=1 Tax=Natrialba aegyptia TaxID=129789 RepID=UPI001267B378
MEPGSRYRLLSASATDHCRLYRAVPVPAAVGSRPASPSAPVRSAALQTSSCSARSRDHAVVHLVSRREPEFKAVGREPPTIETTFRRPRTELGP